MSRKISVVLTDQEYADLEEDAYVNRRSVSKSARLAVIAWLYTSEDEEPTATELQAPELSDEERKALEASAEALVESMVTRPEPSAPLQDEPTNVSPPL